MALHVREQIAVAVLAAVTNLATTGARAWRDRDTDENPLQATELPGLTLEDDGDPAEIVSMGNNRLLERRMRITITAHVKAASGYSSTLNQILKEVEVALGAPGVALGGAKHCTLSGVEAREISEGAELACVRQAFVFELPYYTQHSAPDVAL